MQLRYCPECGQPDGEVDPTLREYAHELAAEFLGWDGKLGVTFRTLLRTPGRLTVEHLRGRRAPYLPPLRLYLTCSVLFFAMSAIVPHRTVLNRKGERVEQGLVQVGKSTPAQLRELDSLAVSAPMPQRVWFEHFARASRSPQVLTQAVDAAIPRAMFVLVPLFAALVMVGFRRRGFHYPQHLTFALHVHAALFLALTVAVISRVIPSSAVGTAWAGLVLLSAAAYAVSAARVVYGTWLASTIARFFCILIAYGVAFVAALWLTLALTVFSF